MSTSLLVDMVTGPQQIFYDDKLVIAFNHKDGAETITLSDIETVLAEQENGSDLVRQKGLERAAAAKLP
ncbi:MAG: hypothetical protein ACI4PO_00210 [Faecousia sp.]